MAGLSANIASRINFDGGILSGNLNITNALTAPTIGNAATMLYGNGSAFSGIGRPPPTITTIQVTDASYNAIDDTTLGVAGGYIIVNGSGFWGGALVKVGGTVATSTTGITMKQLRVQLPAKPAGTYNVQVDNEDGSYALAVNAVTYSIFPAWSTGSTLTSQYKTLPFTETLSALSDSTVTYTGTGLPTGTSLATNGTLSGTITESSTADATYSFTVQATDLENQNTPRTFSLYTQAFVMQKIVYGNTSTLFRFGYSVSLSDDGTRAAIANNAGTIVVFIRSGVATWSLEAILANQIGARYGEGTQISADGTRVITGGPNAISNNNGAARIYVRSGTSWSQEAQVIPSNDSAGYFGESVSISSDGTWAIVGHSYASPSGLNAGSQAGSAYIFVRSGSTWSQQAYLTASDKAVADHFGQSVKISGDGTRALVAAPQRLINAQGGAGAGAVYVFVRSGTTWSQERILVPSDPQSSSYFGVSLSLSNDGSRALIGKLGDAANTNGAYVFTRSGTTWTQEQKIIGSDTVSGDNFGCSVSLSSDGSRAIIGAQKADPGGTTDAGAAYIFNRSGTTWTQQQKLFASDKSVNTLNSNTIGDNFGFSNQSGTGGVWISGNGMYVIIGKPQLDTANNSYVGRNGAAYISMFNGTGWSA